MLPHPVERVFAFFADARNLEAMTPAFLRFRVLTPEPIRMEGGTLIDYRLQLFGVPFGWRTRIEAFVPGVWFSDAQVRGPYRRWYHVHEFTAVPGGTLMTDRVDYELPFGPLGTIADVLFVRRTLDRIFDYRRAQLELLLADPQVAER